MSAYASRIERLRALFDEAKIDGMLISQPESRFYLSGYTGHDLPPRDSLVILSKPFDVKKVCLALEATRKGS